MAIANQIGGAGARHLAAVPVGVAGVDERGQRRAIADGVVEAHQRVPDGEVVGARLGRRLEPLARFARTPERELGPHAQEEGGGIDGRAPAASAAGQSARLLVAARPQRLFGVSLRGRCVGRGRMRRREGDGAGDGGQHGHAPHRRKPI